jgi:hypothetical protein
VRSSEISEHRRYNCSTEKNEWGEKFREKLNTKTFGDKSINKKIRQCRHKLRTNNKSQRLV